MAFTISVRFGASQIHNFCPKPSTTWAKTHRKVEEEEEEGEEKKGYGGFPEPGTFKVCFGGGDTIAVTLRHADC